MAKLWLGHDSGTHTHPCARGEGKLYMPFRHFMAGGIKYASAYFDEVICEISKLYHARSLGYRMCDERTDRSPDGRTNNPEAVYPSTSLKLGA